MDENKLELSEKAINPFNLEKKERDFLFSLGKREVCDPGLAVFTLRKNKVFRVEHFPLPTGKHKLFKEKAPESLWCGGVVGIIRYQGKILVVPDERWPRFKGFPSGVVQFSEGADFLMAAYRELLEEVFVISLGKMKDYFETWREFRYVPNGIQGVIGAHNAALDLKVVKFKEVGWIKPLGYVLNPSDKAVEFVFFWDLPDELKNFTVSANEEWHEGGKLGISVYALNPDGSLCGVFSGQQGFQRFSDYRIHETLEKFM